MRELSPRSRTIIRVLLVVTVLSRLAFALRPEPQLASRPYLEDSYYAFNSAYHLSQGHGLTADGVHKTNGIQPLIVFLYVPFFAIAGEDKWLALRLIFLLIAVIESISIVVLAKLLFALTKGARDDLPEWQKPWIVGPFLWTVLYPLMWHHANGLETGLYAMFILLSLLVYYKAISSGADTSKTWIGFGTILGLAILARIDAVFLVAGFALDLVRRRSLRAIPQIILMGVAAIAVSSSWWIYNLTQFGSLMPISGQSQSQVAVLYENIIRSLVVLADIFSTFFYTPYYSLPTMLLPIWITFVAVVVYTIATRIKIWRFLKDQAHLDALLPLALMGWMLYIFYVFFFSAPHFLPRYLHPVRILWILLVCLSVPILVQMFKASYVTYPRAAVLLIAPVLLAAIFFNANRYLVNFGTVQISELYEAGKWAEARPQAKIGMLQSGTATFISPNVTNLDGKVNPEAMEAIRSTGIGEYIKRERFDYLADVPNLVDSLVTQAHHAGVRYVKVDSVSGVRIYQRVD